MPQHHYLFQFTWLFFPNHVIFLDVTYVLMVFNFHTSVHINSINHQQYLYFYMPSSSINHAIPFSQVIHGINICM
jgi:hypothetical protein